MWYIYKGIVFSHEKEGNPAICNKMIGPWGLSKVSQTEKDKYCMISLICRIKKKTQKKRSDLWAAKGWGGVN